MAGQTTAYVIVHLHSLLNIKPTITIHHRASPNAPHPSTRDPSRRWVTVDCTIPGCPAPVAFDLGVESAKPIIIQPKHVHWDHDAANEDLVMLARDVTYSLTRMRSEHDMHVHYRPAGDMTRAYVQIRKKTSKRPEYSWLEVVEVQVERVGDALVCVT